MTCDSEDGWQDWHGHTCLSFGVHYRLSFEHALPSWLGFISWCFSQRLEIPSPGVTQPSEWRIRVKSDLRAGCLAAVVYTDSDSGANTIDLIQFFPLSRSITWEKEKGTSLIFFSPLHWCSNYSSRHSVLFSILTFSCFFCVFAGDDTLKTWDIRNFKKALNVATGLCSFFPM